MTDSKYGTPNESPGFVLWRVATRWQAALREALAQVELTHAQFVLLATTYWLTRQGDAITQVEIAQHAGTDPVMTSEVLRTLQSKGFVERTAHPTDGRARAVSVSRAGGQLVRRAMPLVEEADEEFFASGSPDLAALAQLLTARVRRRS